MNTVYLVLVMALSDGTTSIAIPQANMKQCQINASYHVKTESVYIAKCIVGVR